MAINVVFLEFTIHWCHFWCRPVDPRSISNLTPKPRYHRTGGICWETQGTPFLLHAASKAASLSKSIAIFVIKTYQMPLVLDTLKKLKYSWLTTLSSFWLYSKVIHIFAHMNMYSYLYICICVCIDMYSFQYGLSQNIECIALCSTVDLAVYPLCNSWCLLTPSFPIHSSLTPPPPCPPQA